MHRAPYPLLLLALALGCPAGTTAGDDDDAADDDTADDDTADDDDDTTAPVEACDRYTTWGYFHLTVDDDNPPETWVGGMVEDGPEPWILDELDREGDCVLYGWDHPPHCEPECDEDEYCGFGDECRTMPAVISVGAVAVTGTDPPLTLDEIDNGVYIGGADFPDLYTPGDLLTVAPSGSSDFDSFELTTLGVAPLGTICEELTMTAHEDIVCDWSPGEVSGARFRFTIYKSDQHGALPAELVCDVDDALGTVVVPASLIQAIWAMDVFDELNPVSATTRRYTQDLVMTDRGCVELRSQTTWGSVYLTFVE